MRIFFIFMLIACTATVAPQIEILQTVGTIAQDSSSDLVQGRFRTPSGYYREPSDSNGFTSYLRNLPLKEPGAVVHYYDGSTKFNNNIYAAVIDMEIGSKDLLQCADAVMRIRAEYLYRHKRYGEISFRFTGDGKMHSYLSYTGNDRSYKKFFNYMEHVFSYANTASLHKQLKGKEWKNISPGDVLVKTGSPYGHAVIVLDVCKDSSGNKQFMLAQSYMPAQEIQVLQNPATGNVWYMIKEDEMLITPEWTFNTTDLGSVSV